MHKMPGKYHKSRHSPDVIQRWEVLAIGRFHLSNIYQPRWDGTADVSQETWITYQALWLW
jgi:hypothetical protein